MGQGENTTDKDAQPAMQIYVDADAFPSAIREILFRAAERRRIPLVLVSNRHVRKPRSALVSAVCVTGDINAADDRIAELVRKGDLVVTADIPLASRVVGKGAHAIDPRGELYTDANIGGRKAMRDLMADLRSGGLVTGGPPTIGRKDVKAFADQLDRFLTRRMKDPARHT